jgi:hypothetical protein
VTQGERERLEGIRHFYGNVARAAEWDKTLRAQAYQDIIFLLDLLSGRPANSSEALRGAEPAEPGAARRFCKAGPEGPAAPDPGDVRVGSTVVFSDWTPSSAGVDWALGPDRTGFYCVGCGTEFATEVELMAHPHPHPPAPPAAP